MAAIFRRVLNFPMPQFGTLGGMMQYSRSVGRALAQPEMVPWAFVAVVGGGWFIWPAIDEDWKNKFGLGEFPEEEEVVVVVQEQPEKPTFDPETQFKIDQAHLKDVEVETEADKIVVAEIKGGDFGSLEKAWESDNKAFMMTVDEEDEEEDEDDDDDDDEDEEEEEEEDDDDE